jgi:hypothetical protein
MPPVFNLSGGGAAWCSRSLATEARAHARSQLLTRRVVQARVAEFLL